MRMRETSKGLVHTERLFLLRLNVFSPTPFTSGGKRDQRTEDIPNEDAQCELVFKPILYGNKMFLDTNQHSLQNLKLEC